jgi:dTDP-4-amino-4,6-dideoxygalactose transaminase
MILTENAELADRIKMLALHGLSKDAWKRFADSGYQHYEVMAIGYNHNLTDLQAALGLAQLAHIEPFARQRALIWEFYNEAFSDLPCDLPPPPVPGTVHAHHLHTPLLRLEDMRVDRDTVLDAMTAENIGVGVHYLAVTQHRFYRDTYGWRSRHVPNAHFIGPRTVSFPLTAGLDDQDIADVRDAFRWILLHFAR